MYKNCTNKHGMPKGWRHKILLIMRLTTVILIASLMQVSAAGLAQKISLSEKNTPLVRVFDKIRLQCGFDFVVDGALLKKAKPVNIQVKDVDLNDVLKCVFENQDLEFTIEDKMVVVSKKEPSLFEDIVARFQTIDVRGRVVDENGRSLPGATVKVKDGSKSVITDQGGNFFLKGIDDNAVLVIAYIGYLTREVNANSNLSEIKLEVSNSKLDEVQIMAYGETTRRLSTSNIGTIKASDIEKQPVNNPLLALQGRIPGIFITQATGMAGTGVTVRIQGQNSLSKGNDPLYVIDGVPYASQVLPTLINVLGGSGNTSPSPSGAGNPLSYINPADIESIDVLKDADATAIYGSRAANGAILITTKKGKVGQTKVDINMQQGEGHVARKLNVLNTEQYLQMRREAIKNDNAAILATDYDINGTWDTTRNTNWQKELIGGASHYTDIQASVSGGNANTQFSVGTGYHRETTVFPGDLSDQKGSLHFNINNVSPNQKFNLQLSGNYIVDNNQIISQDLTGNAVQLSPNAPPLYNADGSLNWSPLPSGNSTWQNPLSYLENKYKVNTKNLIGNLLVSYEILPGLNVKSTFGYTNLQSDETLLAPLLSTVPENRPYMPRYAGFGDGNISSWIIEPQASYKQVIGKAKLELLVGSTILENRSTQQQIYGYGYNSDLVLADINSAPSLSVEASIASTYKYNAVFGRINYSWEDKYIINSTVRRDGSSRFGAKNLFHNFWSIAGAWIFSNEGFMQRTLPFLSFGKLRASYGTTGNDQIGDYQFMNLYIPLGVAVPYQNANGFAPTGLPNPYLEWEETKKSNVGLDLGFFKDRLLLNVNYFRNRSSNQLQAYALPITTGFGGIATNFPATVQNSGLELSLNTTNIKNKVFTWSSNFNLTHPKNKLLAYPNLGTSSSASTLIIGQPITIRKVYHSLGVDPATGLYQFADKDGKPTSNPNPLTDNTALINTSPKFYGGFQNSLRYKNFELDFLFQFVKQTGRNYLHGYRPGLFAGTSNLGNQPATVLQRWQQPGDGATIQRVSTGFGAYFPWSNASSFSDAAFSDASFIRLRNLSFSWQLPDAWKQKVRLKNCRLYTQGQNLMTITNYSGMDPETGSSTTLPPLRVLTLGLQITL